MTERRYSTSGPQCPYCGHEATPDEPFYYDEATTELECGECEKTYAVEVYHETSWRTSPREREQGSGE